ncbi:hypothetical protein NY635_19265 [Klebsiella pneumoniae]|uniref:hypothetical protein n=1 Tax=Klebsiella pneumoniae TaxID=573 RepID=UPI00234DA5E8|nr:hypothetical protein [Klebsiella pneumoniae]MDC6730230.1 hypothetical protein [Klebsiella pneumoniae]
MVTEKELIAFDLLQNFGERWKYRYSAGAKYIFASSKARAIEGATEAFRKAREGANKRGNSSRLTQSFHFFMFEPIFSPVNALNQPI